RPRGSPRIVSEPIYNVRIEGFHDSTVEPDHGRNQDKGVGTVTENSVPQESYVIGVDYGTLSGRAVVVRVSDGAELGSAVLEYPHAVMDTTLAATGKRLPPDWALQVPQDYVEVLKSAVPEAV